MKLDSLVPITDGKTVIELPLENFLRIFFFHMQPLIIEYQQETGKSDVVGLVDWLKEKLHMKGGSLLV